MWLVIGMVAMVNGKGEALLPFIALVVCLVMSHVLRIEYKINAIYEFASKVNAAEAEAGELDE